MTTSFRGWRLLTAMVAALLAIPACTHESVAPAPVVVAQAPAGLAYSNNRLELEVGTPGQSVVPTVQGTAPISYTITTVPASVGELSIDAQGVISAGAALAEGTYAVSIVATNAAGATPFPNVFTVVVTRTPHAPANLRYTPDSVVVAEGTAAVSVAPAVDGTTPFVYSLTSTPATSLLTIDSTGVIHVPATLPDGRYAVTVTATNSTGSVTFPNAYQVIVQPLAPAGLVYAPNSLNLAAGVSGSSTVPTVSGSQPLSFALRGNPAGGLIAIDPTTGVITATSRLSAGIYPLDVEVTNAGAAVVFSNVYSVVVAVTTTPPTNLTYATNTLSLMQGTGGTSVAPTIQGTTPIAFALTSNPATNLISIDPATGIIAAAAGLAPGTYTLSVTATNAAGGATFNGVFSVVVTAAVSPANLVYAPTSLTVVQGSTAISAIPTITGTQPIAYTLTVQPATVGITIGSQGEILVSSAVAAGSYSVSVTATNSAGTATFTNAFTVVVSVPAITFANNVRPLMLSRCGNCHTGGSGQINFTVYANASANINQILDRVQRTPGSQGFMPQNRTALTAAQITMLQQWLAQGLQP